MRVVARLISAGIVLTLLVLDIATAKPHFKKSRHHVKSRDHLEEVTERSGVKDPWASPDWHSWDPFREDLGQKSFPFGGAPDDFEARDLKHTNWEEKPSDLDPVDKVKGESFKSKEFSEPLGKEKAYKTREYDSLKTDGEDKSFKDLKSFEEKAFTPIDKLPVPADTKDEKSVKDLSDKKTSVEGKGWTEPFEKPPQSFEKSEKGDGKTEKAGKGTRKFGGWPLGDDTDKLPQPTTAATKLHPLKLSKPIVRCKTEQDCPMSRVCKDKLCHCADKTYCAGHSSPVCGSDGILYPSHCELHRTACVNTVHIRIDHKGLCFEKEKGSEAVGYLPVTNFDPLKKDDLDLKPKVRFEDAKKPVDEQQVKDPVKEGSFDDKKYFKDGLEKDYGEKDSEKKEDWSDELSEKENTETKVYKDDSEKKSYDNDSPKKIYDDDSVKKIYDDDIAKKVYGAENKEKEYDKYGDKKIYDKKDSFKEDQKESEEKKLSRESTDKSLGDKTVPAPSEVTTEKNDKIPATKKTAVDSKPYLDDAKFDDDYSDEYYDDDFSLTPADKKTLGDVKGDLQKQLGETTPEICSDEEYHRFKEQLLRYHCAKFEEPDCDSEVIEKRKFLASIMFSYYDRNFDDFLDRRELEEIETKEHFEDLSASCILMDILRLEDSARDGKLSIDEFFNAFSLQESVLDDRVKTLSLLATAGHGLELTCGIQGVKDIVWKRHGVDVNSLHMDDISAFEDGTLYISHVGVHHMGNFSCHDRKNPGVVQTHLIKVQMAPQVRVMPGSQLHRSHTDVTLKCHAEGVPAPRVSWEINEVAVPNNAKHFERRNENHTLVIHNSDYQTDTGAYKCRAENTAGVAQDIATVFIQNYNHSHINGENRPADNMFLVFHNKGYHMYEPERCLVRHQVTGDFTNLKYFPEMMDSVPTLCGERECDWGAAINVANKFVYASQPSLNRVVLIDLEDQWNPVQLVDTDKQPVGLHYVPHLDQVWVLCWNGGHDSGSKTMVVIRDASKQQRHHVVHTLPVGNRFDLIQDMFLPPANDLGHRFEFGYVVHTGQRGLYKLELEEMKYIKALDFNKHNCHPKSLVFIPLGGMIVIQCQAETIDATHHFQLVVDYLSDIVVSNSSLRGRPFVSPDSRHLVTVDSITGEVTVQSVTDQGSLKKAFSVNTGAPISEVAFHPSATHRGYDLYMSSRTKGVVYFMDLSTGKLRNVDGIEERVQDSWLWDGMNHALVGSGLFGDFLLTTTDSSAIIVDSRLNKVLCEFRDLKNSHVVVWVRPEAQ